MEIIKDLAAKSDLFALLAVNISRLSIDSLLGL
jgi:hypothetical protein